MPYLVTTSVYPSHISSEVAQRYLQAMEKYPLDENSATALVPAAVKGTQQGIRTIGIQEVRLTSAPWW